MDTENESEPDTGRNADGTFKPGVSGNPDGKRRGQRHRITLAVQEMLEGEHERITKAAIDKALAGDMAAVRLVLERLLPPRKDSPVCIDLPPITGAEDTAKASAALVAAVTSGEITPDEGARIMALLVSHKGIIEAGELERRIAELEAKSGKQQA